MPMRKWYIIFCNQDNLNKYSLNQFILHAQGKIEIDSKQQKSLTTPNIWTTQDIPILLPDVETTFLPVRIQKFIYSSKTKTKMNQPTNIEVRGNYYDNICGIDQEEIYSLDLWTFPMDNKIEEPVFTFESIILQQVQGAHSGRWSMEQTIYDKLNRTTDLPNTDHKKYLNTIVKDYCMQKVWTDSPITKDISHLLPSPNQIFNNELNSISNQDLIESIEPLTWHSTQLRLIQLIKHFPRLKPLLITSNKYDIFFGDDDEIEETFQQVKFLLSATKTQQISYSICQYLQLQYEQQQTKDNSFQNYRLRIFWLTDSDCSDVLPILDRFRNLSQQTGLLIDLYYADSDSIQLANAQQTFNTHLTNQTKNLSIIYDETIDLCDSKTLEKIPIESFDIIFSTNQLQENQDLINSLIDLRRLLVPNDLLLLLALVHVPLYFDLIFGFIDQWWSSDDNNQQIQEFNSIESTINQNESTFIISQKTISNDILQTLDERINQTCDDDLAFEQNEELICGTLSRILQTIQKSSPYFYPFVYVLTDHAQFNNDSNLNLIASSFIEEKCKFEQISIIPKRDAGQKPFRLCVPRSCFLSQLTWIEEDREEELLPSDMVEVRVHCVGVNFRDVLKSREPGSDFVDTIVRACPTTNFQVGDHVVGGTSNSTYHSHIMINSQLIIRIPSDFPLTDEQLCGMPTPILTVIYSRKYCVHLQSGQTVLIHATTGAASQWCIQYCQYIGTRVIATAGTEEKRCFLREYYGIEHVFNSQDTSFVNNIREILPQGIDVIVNSLSGNLLKESIKLLAYHGHFVEWGKRDIYHNGNLSMFQLRTDCSFHMIDFAGLADHLFIQRKLHVIEPIVGDEPSQVIEALLRYNSGQVMGKTFFRITSSDQLLHINKKQSNSLLKVVSDNTMFPSEVCNEGTILISGGFGGLGLTMSRWVIEQRGVKHIALMSRRTLVELEKPSNPQYDEWLKLKRIIKEFNAHIDVVQADTSYPIRDIFHSAVAVEDRTLNNLTEEHLSLVLPPKVRGAWYLHQATQLLDAPIHFFIMFSSIRNHLLEVASAGYNAGNKFLDALAHYRFEKLNLTAFSISLPAVSGAGMFHRHKEMLSTLKVKQGFELMPTVTVFELIEFFHQTQKICPCPVIFAVNWQILHRNYTTLATSYLRKIVGARHKEMKFDQISSSTLSGKSNSTESIMNKKETIIERTQSTVAGLLGAASVDRIDVDRSLVSQGMDSLAAVSLYNWLVQETGIYIPLVDLLQGLSIETIATLVYNKLNEKEQTKSSAAEEQDSDFELINENEVQYSNTSTYTGLENIICLHRSNQNNTSTLFCITQISNDNNNEDLYTLFIQKLSNQKNKISLNDMYALQILSSLSSSSISTYAQNLIRQMRRIQSYGSYRIIDVRRKLLLMKC
ncbi:unnamed protein product [Adineta steineri]|uniref:Carrier domain-containing protein n=1 Tax=Adineta steineri TaxID=433720 RepID=A0A814LLT2_9BILA|nr:unnamed protein product [Adineta steineri]CAF4085226.1 unnamed protein product [Adineta steineri]